ncbi:hypothetical protein GWN28_14580, partial [candidate division KSB1 bacterium]|nr:hypothetical protein [candidate division KSB1 bacterium]NIW19561.1 hypothetical protein [candidate division KSB1 bacterium]
MKERRSKPHLEIEREKARLEGLRNQYQQQKTALDEQLTSLPKLEGDLSAVEKNLIELHN